jgi:nitrite reductase/ring-hydroxylating ferredoxin subunit|nr:Rieske 2Fe-2S domain-containing protein [Kofleriaceae bacterium]
MFDARLDADAVGDLAVGQIVPARVRACGGSIDVAVARLASGRVVVVEDACPHDGRPISANGYVDGERIVCGRHGRAFDACRGTLCA